MASTVKSLMTKNRNSCSLGMSPLKDSHGTPELCPEERKNSCNPQRRTVDMSECQIFSQKETNKLNDLADKVEHLTKLVTRLIIAVTVLAFFSLLFLGQVISSRGQSSAHLCPQVSEVEILGQDVHDVYTDHVKVTSVQEVDDFVKESPSLQLEHNQPKFKPPTSTEVEQEAYLKLNPGAHSDYIVFGRNKLMTSDGQMKTALSDPTYEVPRRRLARNSQTQENKKCKLNVLTLLSNYCSRHVATGSFESNVLTFNAEFKTTEPISSPQDPNSVERGSPEYPEIWSVNKIIRYVKKGSVLKVFSDINSSILQYNNNTGSFTVNHTGTYFLFGSISVLSYQNMSKQVLTLQVNGQIKSSWPSSGQWTVREDNVVGSDRRRTGHLLVALHLRQNDQLQVVTFVDNLDLFLDRPAYIAFMPTG